MTKTVSIRVEEELIEKLKTRSERNGTLTFNGEIVNILQEFMEVEMWGRLYIQNVFTAEELNQIKKPTKTMRFAKEAFLEGVEEEVKQKILSLNPLEVWALWCSL